MTEESAIEARISQDEMNEHFEQCEKSRCAICDYYNRGNRGKEESEMTVKLVPVGEFEWTDDYSKGEYMTCRNHPTAKYSTKNPFFRGIHVLRLPDGEIERTATGECTCPFVDLAVIVNGETGRENA